MFDNLLVPLDGSRLAEAALPAAQALATRFEARVTLLHLIEAHAPAAVHGEPHLTDTAEATRYLQEIAERWFAGGATVRTHVHREGAPSVASGIVSHANELGADLIILCTHGRGGLRHRLFGSIAQHVVANVTVPVFLVPPEDVDTTFTCHRLLVPLDARAEHEQGIPVGAAFARAFEAECYVLAVVPTLATLSGEQARTGAFLPRTTAGLLDIEEKQAEAYVRGQVAHLAEQGLSVTAEVRRGDPADVIVRTAQRRRADVIVLATHGKSGLGAFWAGSVAPRVSRRAQVPLMLVSVVHAAEAA